MQADVVISSAREPWRQPPLVGAGALPEAETGFVGRREELRTLAGLLAEDGRLVTLVGAPGAGKTRLALELGRVAMRGGLEPVHVDLSVAGSAEGVCRRIAEALSVTLADADGVDAALLQLGRALSRRGTALLVLDDCEGARAEAAQVLRSLRRAAPALRTLVTSRQRLGLEGEHLVEVGPLPSPPETEADPEAIARSEAVQLLLSRARQRGCEGPLAGSDAVALGAVARALDGNPLALELAAARLPVLGVSALLALLDDRLDLLVDGSEGSPARWSSVERAVRWSWDLLDAAEQGALGRLSVFRGSFTAEAAERVLSVEGGRGGVERLQALMDRSLVRAEGSPFATGARRLSLDASVRAFAARQLEATGGAEAARTAHAAFYVEALGPTAEGAHLFGGEPLRRRLLAERANLLAVYEWGMTTAPARPDLALRALLALAPVTCTEGPFGEYLHLLDEAHRAAERLGRADTLVSAAALVARGVVESRRGRFDLAVSALEGALPLVRRAGSRPTEAYVLIVLGGLLPFVYRQAESPKVLDRARKLVASLGDERLEAILHKEVASTMMWRAPEQAELVLERALMLFRLTRDRVREAYCLAHLAACRVASGKLDEAERSGARALERLDGLADERWAAQTRAVLSLCALERGRSEEAEAALVRALEVQRRVGNPWLEGFALVALAEVRLDLGRVEEARTGLLEALEIARPIDERITVAWATASLGRAAAAAGELEVAEGLIDEAVEGARSLFDPALLEGIELRRGHVDLARCRAAAEAGDPGAALAWLEAARARAVRHEGSGERLRALLRLPLRALQRAIAAASDALERGLVVGEDGRWFAVGMAEAVSLRRRPRLRLLLARLASERLRRPGAGLALHELFEAGWPGERARPDSAANRVYVSLTRLRNLGLADILTCEGEGFLLDPGTPLTLGGP